MSSQIQTYDTLNRVIVSLMIIGAVYNMIGVIAIWKYWNSNYVRNRGIQSHLVSSFFGIVATYLMLIAIYYDLPCYVVESSVYFFLFFSFTFISVRAFEIYVAFIANKQAVHRTKSVFVALDSTAVRKENASQQFLVLASPTASSESVTLTAPKKTLADLIFENRRYLHMGFFSPLKIAGIISSVFTGSIVMLSIHFSNPSISTSRFFSDECLRNQKITWNIYFGMTVIGMLMCRRVIKELQVVKENFEIIQEFKLLTSVAIFIFPFYVSWTIPTSNEIRGWNYLTFFVALENFVTIGTHRIAWKAYRLEHPKNSSLSPSGTSGHANNRKESGATATTPIRAISREQFRDMLLDDSRYRKFEEFLCKEFSVENGCFWRASEKFRSTLENDLESGRLSISLIKHRLNKLYNEFCCAKSAMSINISGAALAKLIELKDSDSIFDPAEFKNQSIEVVLEMQSEIFELMYKDSLRRFVKSAEADA